MEMEEIVRNEPFCNHFVREFCSTCTLVLQALWRTKRARKENYIGKCEVRVDLIWHQHSSKHINIGGQETGLEGCKERGRNV